jgi:predicted anti-sigma-YlaC factor YlaD
LFAALSDYIDGVVDDVVCEQMNRHLADCQPCEAFLRSLKQAVERCLCVPKTPPDLKTQRLPSFVG